MSAQNPHFDSSDLEDDLPEEGLHEALIHAARLRTSERGNLTVQVIYHLIESPAVAPGVVEYFVIEGASPTALAISRRRLVALYRACGLVPEPGEAIEPKDLVGAKLDIRIGHESYAGTRRPRVLGYRARP